MLKQLQIAGKAFRITALFASLMLAAGFSQPSYGSICSTIADSFCMATSCARSAYVAVVDWLANLDPPPPPPSSTSQIAFIQHTESNIQEVEKLEREGLALLQQEVRGRRPHLDRSEIQEIYDYIRTMPVTNLENYLKYVPDQSQGLCFGRAMGVHLAALWLHGLANNRMRKIFAAGYVTVGRETFLNFHVATALLADDGKWYVVDTLLNEPMAVRDYYMRLKQDTRGDSSFTFFGSSARAYVAKRLDERITLVSVYARERFHVPEVKQYFEDLLAELQEQRQLRVGRQP